MADLEKGGTMVRDFSKVILTLDNVLIPPDKLSPTPSMSDGLDKDTEIDLRIVGCELIQTSGILLKLPQVAMATGQVLFQRFYYSKSFVKHNMVVVAMACINLASKIEESPRRIRDVINVFHHVKQVREGRNIQPLILDQNYINLKNQVIKSERRLLKELGFCVHVKHPHKVIVMYLQVLDCESNVKLVQCAWNYMNDSFRTDVFVQYDPETIACACIYLAARQLQIPLPYNPPWFSILNQEEHHITEICLTILRLYARSKPNLDKLEAKVNECKKLHVEAKLKMKGLSSSNTPNSTHNSPKNISPSPLSVQNLKRQKDEDTSDHSGSGRNNYVSKKKKRHYSRSRSRSFSSRSRSRSFSSSPRRKYKSPHRKYKKESKRDDWSRTRKRKTSVSPYTNRRSYSRSPDYKTSKKSYYKDKDRYISADRYTSDRSFEKYDSKYYDKPKAKKHSNGHRRSRTPERYRR